MSQYKAVVEPVANAAAPITVDMLAGNLPASPRLRPGPTSGLSHQIGLPLLPVTFDAAPFSIEMTLASRPETNRVEYGPRIPLPLLPVNFDQAPFTTSMVDGNTPARNRERLGVKIPLPTFQPVQNEAPFSVEMVVGQLPNGRYITKIVRIDQAQTPQVDNFSIEMVLGNAPLRHRQFLAPKIGLPLSQTTHVPAAFSIEMVTGNAPTSPRIWIAPRLGLPVSIFETLTPPVVTFQLNSDIIMDNWNEMNVGYDVHMI